MVSELKVLSIVSKPRGLRRLLFALLAASTSFQVAVAAGAVVPEAKLSKDLEFQKIFVDVLKKADGLQAVKEMTPIFSEASLTIIQEFRGQTDQRIDQLGVQLGKLDTRSGNDMADARAHIDSNVAAVRKTVQAVEGVAADAAGIAGKASAEVAQLQKVVGKVFQSDAVVVGGDAQAVGESSVAMGAQARAEGNKATAVGRDAVAVADNSVALGAGSVAARNNTVSIGRAGGERQITHIAAGTRDTDAVSVSQLAGATAAATRQANGYTDQRFAQIRHDLKEQDNTLSAGIAGAMAMASLPRSVLAGSSMTSVAMGNYRGESALAVGVSYISSSGRWSSNFMGTANTRNDAGAAVGVGYQW